MVFLRLFLAGANVLLGGLLAVSSTSFALHLSARPSDQHQDAPGPSSQSLLPPAPKETAPPTSGHHEGPRREIATILEDYRAFDLMKEGRFNATLVEILSKERIFVVSVFGYTAAFFGELYGFGFPSIFNSEPPFEEEDDPSLIGYLAGMYHEFCHEMS